MVQPSYWTDTISLLYYSSSILSAIYWLDTIGLLHYQSHSLALSLNRYHQSPSLFVITWFSPLTDQIPSVFFIINHMFQPSHWTDIISLLHYSSSHGSALSLTRHHQSLSLFIITGFSPPTWPVTISLLHYQSHGSALSLNKYHQSP